MILEAYLETTVFGLHRWMIRGSEDRAISDLQFTSKHDAETAIGLGFAIAEQAKQELADKIRDILP